MPKQSIGEVRFWGIRTIPYVSSLSVTLLGKGKDVQPVGAVIWRIYIQKQTHCSWVIRATAQQQEVCCLNLAHGQLCSRTECHVPQMGTMAKPLLLILIFTSLSSLLKAEGNGKKRFFFSWCSWFNFFLLRNGLLCCVRMSTNCTLGEIFTGRKWYYVSGLCSIIVPLSACTLRNPKHGYTERSTIQFNGTASWISVSRIAVTVYKMSLS